MQYFQSVFSVGLTDPKHSTKVTDFLNKAASNGWRLFTLNQRNAGNNPATYAIEYYAIWEKE